MLIIDDMGMKQLPKRSGEYLFEIIMRRNQVRSTIMTSNRPLEDWGKLIGDVPAATAILDRFLHNAEVIAITGRSYRLRNQHQAADEAAHAAVERKDGLRLAAVDLQQTKTRRPWRKLTPMNDEPEVRNDHLSNADRRPTATKLAWDPHGR